MCFLPLPAGAVAQGLPCLHPGGHRHYSKKADVGSGGKKAGGGKKGGSTDAAPAAPSTLAAAYSSAGDLGGEHDVVQIILQAVENVKPFLTVKSQKVAAKVAFVPGTLAPAQQQSLAIRWLLQAAAARKKSSKADFHECLALELLLAYQKKGGARQKRDDVHKLALQHRANINMRWW